MNEARILVIEDNQANMELMTYLLAAFGFESQTATEGETGVDMVRRLRPELVVCDIQLPKMDGYAVAAALKGDDDLRRIPLLAVTALAMVGDRDKIIAAGFDGYIPKPIDPETFVQTIKGFLCRPETEPTAASHRPSRAPVVLVVDDRSVNLNLMRSTLGPLGYSVVEANAIEEAFAVANRLRPDLIISDVDMADGTGFDFIQKIKGDAALRNIPFVFITSTYCNETHRRRGLSLGAARFLFRPIDAADLLREVQSCLDNKAG